MKNKLPKELDPQEVFNIIHRAMWEAMRTGKAIANDTSLTLEQRLESVTHLSARIGGMCDVLNALGYEIRDEQGLLVTSKISLLLVLILDQSPNTSWSKLSFFVFRSFTSIP